MKISPVKLGIFGFIILVALAWIIYYHNARVAGLLPKWAWMQAGITHLGQQVEAPPEPDDDPDNTKNEIPVRTAHVTTATLHRYVEGIGTVSPRPGASATIVSSTAGVVAKVLCQLGQAVHAGDVLIQLDDRLAKSAEDQAAAALAAEQAALTALKASPRPEQLQISELAVEKARNGADFAQKNYDRLKELEAQASAKSIEQAASDLQSARNDLLVAQKQLELLKPTPEEFQQEQAKVAAADAALATARVQRGMLAIRSPIDATVAAVSVNPGESVDTTKTLVQLIALDKLMVDVDVPADQLPADAMGLAAIVGSDVTGKVAMVSPQVDARNGAVMVGVDLPPDAKLRPGLTVRLRIVAEEHKNCLVVPREAVVADENGDNFIALVDKDQATHKTVKIGLEENGQIEIIADGVKEGDTVVTSGAFGLMSTQATRVKVLD